MQPIILHNYEYASTFIKYYIKLYAEAIENAIIKL